MKKYSRLNLVRRILLICAILLMIISFAFSFMVFWSNQDKFTKYGATQTQFNLQLTFSFLALIFMLTHFIITIFLMRKLPQNKKYVQVIASFIFTSGGIAVLCLAGICTLIFSIPVLGWFFIIMMMIVVVGIVMETLPALFFYIKHSSIKIDKNGSDIKK